MTPGRRRVKAFPRAAAAYGRQLTRRQSEERRKQDDKMGKGGNKTTEKILAKAIPRAAAAYGRQLKNS